MLLFIWVFPSLRRVSWAQFWEFKMTLTLIAAIHMGSIVLNNLSLEWLGLSINQIIKGAAPLPTMFFAFLLVGSRYSLAVVLTVAALAAGCVVAVPPTEFRTSAEGIIAAILSMLLLSLKQVLYERVLSNSSATGLDPFAITFWQFALGAPMLFVLWVCNANNERAAVLVYWRDRAPTAIWIATASALLALAYNMSTLWLTKVTSALTLNIVSTIKFILVIVIPGLADREFVAYNWVGVALYFLSLCLYTVLSVPAEVERYDNALKLDEEEGDRFFWLPGGKFLFKGEVHQLIVSSRSQTFTVTPPLRDADEHDRLWGHHISETDPTAERTDCCDWGKLCFSVSTYDEKNMLPTRTK